jgi:hypothetical protein
MNAAGALNGLPRELRNTMQPTTKIGTVILWLGGPYAEDLTGG